MLFIKLQMKTKNNYFVIVLLCVTYLGSLFSDFFFLLGSFYSALEENLILTAIYVSWKDHRHSMTQHDCTSAGPDTRGSSESRPRRKGSALAVASQLQRGSCKPSHRLTSHHKLHFFHLHYPSENSIVLIVNGFASYNICCNSQER